jgi:hypothetical protein
MICAIIVVFIQKLAKFEIVYPKNLFKFYLKTSSFYEQSHPLSGFGLCRKKLLGAHQGALAPIKKQKHYCIDGQNLFSSFCSANPKIIGVKVCYRQTE